MSHLKINIEVFLKGESEGEIFFFRKSCPLGSVLTGVFS